MIDHNFSRTHKGAQRKLVGRKMNRLITQAVVFGVAISEAKGNFLKLGPNLSHEGGGGMNPAKAYFEYLNQCSFANLDLDSCLASNTVAAFAGMEGPPADDDDFVKNDDGTVWRRFLEGDMGEVNCSPFDVSEQDLRDVMGLAQAQCVELGYSITDQDFQNTLAGFLKIANSDSNCHQDMCDENPPPLFLEIMFDEMAKCAHVDLSTQNTCLSDHIFQMMFSGGDSTETDGIRRKLQDSSSCPSESEVGFLVSYMLMDVEAKCTELGSPPSSEELDKAASDLVTIFMAQHCWGNEGCNEGNDHLVVDDDDDQYEDNDQPVGDAGSAGVNYMDIALKYVEQCAALDLNTNTCLTSSTLDTFASWGAAPNDQSPGHRFLQTTSDGSECVPPELDEEEMRFIVDMSKSQCSSHGLEISDQEMDGTVDDFMALFGAQECWVALCEEGSNPSDELISIVFEETAECAGAKWGQLNPCLLDQLLEIIYSSDSSDDALDAVRRRLEHTLGGSGEIDDDMDPCLGQPSDAELDFVVSLLLLGAQEQCMELGQALEEGEIAEAKTELMKLFGAQHCWGIPDDCKDATDDNGKHAEYLEFLQEGTTWMLAQCAAAQEVSCVFSRSVEVMHGMKHMNVGWTHDGHTGPHDLAQQMQSSICVPPSPLDYDVEQIATHALEHCKVVGAHVMDSHYDQAVSDLQNLLSKPDCWEDLCESETKGIIVEEWMHTCASIDLGFLTSHELHMLHDDSLDNASLDQHILQCMVKYIAPDMWGPHANWACILPRVGDGVCNMDIGKEAYHYCGGEDVDMTYTPTASTSMPPSPSPSMHLSMSFAYTESDTYDWADFDHVDMMSFSYSLDDSFSMPNGDYSEDHELSYDDDTTPYDDDVDGHHNSEMHMYIEEVCSLISDLNSDASQLCLQPICDNLWVEDTLVDTDDDHYGGNTWMPTMVPTMIPTTIDTKELANPTLSPSTRPTTLPPVTPLPTTLSPTARPTSVPTREPTSSPTMPAFGSVSVSVEVEVKLEGINITDLDVTALDEVVDLLESVLGDMLPEGATVRLLSVGGFSVTRRLLRFLQNDGSGGVDVQFEIIMTQTCSSATCDSTEIDQISNTLSQDVTSDLKAKVESGELTTAIQEKAVAAGVSELSSVSVNASSMQISEPTVTVKEGNDDEPEDPTDDDDSASARLQAVLSLLVVLGSILLI